MIISAIYVKFITLHRLLLGAESIRIQYPKCPGCTRGNLKYAVGRDIDRYAASDTS
jgi:hypothetical protein